MKNIILSIIPLTMLFSACSQKYPLDLGGGYKIEYDPASYFCLVDTNNTIVVNAHITKFKFDSIFIIIEQKPVDLILKDTYNNPDWNLKKRDSLFEESTLRSYWIINKRKACSYGPYQKNKYLEKMLKLKVPQELLVNEK